MLKSALSGECPFTLCVSVHALRANRVVEIHALEKIVVEQMRVLVFGQATVEAQASGQRAATTAPAKNVVAPQIWSRAIRGTCLMSTHGGD